MCRGGGGHCGDGDLEERDLCLHRDRDDERRQDNKGHLVEHREAEDEADNDHRDLDLANAEFFDERIGQARRSAGVHHEFADDRSEHNDDGQRAKGGAESDLDGLQQLTRVHPFQEADRQRGDEERHHGVDLEFHVEHQHERDANDYPNNVHARDCKDFFEF